jgi:hypothetical protein
MVHDNIDFGGFTWFGYFVDNQFQGPGVVTSWDDGRYFGELSGLTLVEVYSYEQYTEEYKAARNSEIANTLAEVNAMIAGHNTAVSQIWAASDARTATFNENLKNSLPSPQYKLVPNYSGIINPDGSFIIGN